MASSAPDLLVYASILFWQSRELPLLEACVESLLRQRCPDGVDLRVMVISNGCQDEPRLPEDPRVEFLQLEKNRGFAGGHNVGIKRALQNGASHVLLFNSDATAEPGLLKELWKVARAHPRAAFVGPLIVRAKDPRLIESAGQSFNTATGRHTELLRGHPVDAIDRCPRKVDAVSGCALLASRLAIESIGVLDDGLFSYFEDMDWCLRARCAGYDVLVAPAGRVRHVGEGSTGGASTLSTFYSVRNHLIVAARYGGPWTGPLVVGYHLAYLARSPDRRTRKHLIAAARGAWAARAHRR